jgi:hypothetical protein
MKNLKLSHLLERSCTPVFGTREGLSLWISWNEDTHNQFCLLCEDIEEAEDVNCKRQARKERKKSPSA